ncbi:MAG: aldehyde dehydrogenase family protein [Mycobacteriales bacterium]
MRTEGHFIGGAWQEPSGDTFEVINPYDGRVLAVCAAGGTAQVNAAVAAAGQAMASPLPAYERAALCDRIAALIRADIDGFAAQICAESGKPIKTARAEAERAVSTWTFAAATARTMTGETVPMDAAPAGAGKLAFTLREPRGVLAAITPFNFPLNLVAHKLAPALAAGCATVLKPAEKTPLSAGRLVRLMVEAEVPAGWINLVNGTGEATALPLATHPDVAVVSFTGSTRVGHSLAAAATGKHVLLELGSNSPVVVAADADLAAAARKVAASGFTHAGQSCISVQRVFVEGPAYRSFLDLLVPAVQALRLGDPADESTDVGPLIRASERDRVVEWIDEARRGGAEVLTGGTLEGDLLRPTVVAGGSPNVRLCTDEVFGPVVVVQPCDSVADGVARANDSVYGLNAAVFTSSISVAMRAARDLRAGAVLINETPTFRADQMPYGGVGESGNTREGPAYAARELTVEKLVIFEA